MERVAWNVSAHDSACGKVAIDAVDLSAARLQFAFEGFDEIVVAEDFEQQDLALLRRVF